MLVALIAESACAQGRLGLGEGDARRISPCGGEGDSHLERVQRSARVAVGPVRQVGQGVVVGLRVLGRQAAVQQHPQRVVAQRLQPEERRSRQERSVDLEVGVLGGGADQGEHTLFDRGQQGVLLRLVEAVHLVEEQDRALPVLRQAAARELDDVAHVLHTCRHRRARLEGPAGRARHQPGERGLARARRSPQDHRRQPVGLDEGAQRLSRAEESLLAHHLVERRRAQPGRERRLGRQPLLQRGPEEVAFVGRGHRRDASAGSRQPSER